MKTFEIIMYNEGASSSHFIKTDASKESISDAIVFLRKAPGEKSIESLLIALRVLGFKATQIKLEAEDVFEL
jgi:hypothetical protein